jgi:DNA-binding transcriptional ArsR family regulator
MMIDSVHISQALDLKFAALADPVRRAILARLARGEATVSELSKPFAISQPAISRHLKLLEAAGLIEGGQVAQTRPRRLKPEALKEATDWAEGIRTLWHDSFDRLDAYLKATDPEG